MKRIVIALMAAFFFLISFAHEGEDHGAAKKATATSQSYFSSEALSDKYEVLIKYGELEGGTDASLQLYLSDARTNRAIDSATISVKLLNHPDQQFVLTRLDTGIYQL